MAQNEEKKKPNSKPKPKQETRLILSETYTIFTNSAVWKNPVLTGALGLFPIVAAGSNLRSGLELSLLFLLLSIPVNLLMCGVGSLVPKWMRPGAVMAAAAVFYIPAAWLVNLLIPGALNTLGVFAVLMACNSIILSRANNYAPSHIFWAALADVLGTSLGFAVLICAVSALREYLQRGSIGNTNLGAYAAADKGTALPFFGLILLGFAAAGLQWLNRSRAKKAADRKAGRA